MSSISKLYLDVNAEGFAPVDKAAEAVLQGARAQFQKNNPLFDQVKTVIQNSLPRLPENLVPDENAYSPKTMEKLDTKLKELSSKPPKRTRLWSQRDWTNYALNDVLRKIDPSIILTRSTTSHFSVNALAPFLGREATADELLNFYRKRPLNAKICEDDPKITPLYLINWKKIKALNLSDALLTSPVTLEEMKTYLNWERLPTPQEQLHCLMGRKLDDPSTNYSTYDAYKINLKKGRDLTTKVTVEEVAEFFGSTAPQLDHCNVLRQMHRRNRITIHILRKYLEREPTPDELFNWIEERDLNCKITSEERNHHVWQDDVNAYLGKKGPVSLRDLQKRLPNATWQQHLNCNLRRRLRHSISLDEFREYIKSNYNRPPTLEKEMNWLMNTPFNETEDKDRHPWKIHVNAHYKRGPYAWVKKTELETVLRRSVTPQEHENCNLSKPLSYKPATESENVSLR